MSIQIQRRGGTTQENQRFIGKSREITVDIGKNTLVVHDGQTQGGFPLAREDLENVLLEILLAKGLASNNADNFTDIGARNLIEITLSHLSGLIVQGPMSEIPGYLICDGSEVSRNDYSRLFTRIGTLFGPGDTKTTFNLPDYRGIFLRGLGGGSESDFNIIQRDAIRNIKGFFGNLYSDATNYGWGPANANGAFKLIAQSATGRGFSANHSSLVNGFEFEAANTVPTAAENRPLNMAVNFFIKY